MTAAYAFVSQWQIPATRARCWEVLAQTLDPTTPAIGPEPAWWPGVEIRAASSPLEAGTTLRLVVRSPLGYRLRAQLTIVEVASPETIVVSSDGDLRGAGRLDIVEGPGGTGLTWQWAVDPQRRWMRVAGPVLRPLFAAAHAAVMRRGERGLARLLSG